MNHASTAAHTWSFQRSGRFVDSAVPHPDYRNMTHRELVQAVHPGVTLLGTTVRYPAPAERVFFSDYRDGTVD